MVVYLNGVEISRTRMPAGPITNTTFASATVNDAVYEGPTTSPASALVTGTNLLAAEVHQAAVSGNDVVFGLSLEATVPSAPVAAIRSDRTVHHRDTEITERKTIKLSSVVLRVISGSRW